METMKKFILPILVLLFLASLLTSGYFYWELNKIKANPTVATEDANKILIKNLGKLILLPGDETPTIATVTDPSKLTDQIFFANAQVGHKVIVYTIAKKAILYDPVANKVIEVGPVNVTDESLGADGGTATEPKEE